MSTLAQMKAQRQRKLNLTADAIFSSGISEEEYEAIQEAANYRPCAWCGKSYRWTLLSYTGPMAKLGDQYCDPRCVEKAEREHALLNKQQSTSTTSEAAKKDPELIGWI